MHILAADVGGTNTRLIVARYGEAGLDIVAEKNYSSGKYADFYEIINLFLADHAISIPLAAACVAVAGPVKSAQASVTNLPWVITEESLAQLLRTPRVRLINDFVAVAHGISQLKQTDLLVLQDGINKDADTILKDAVVIGAGTGLGAAHLVWREDHYQAYSSEAGHAAFAPASAQQRELLGWLQQEHGHVSVETLLSGRGLPTIYRFLHDVTGIYESAQVRQAMHDHDPAQVIAEQALLGKDELCVKTLDCFVDIYGAAASNIVLHYYPVGELYIAGGIAPKIKDKMLEKRFTDAFINKGLMTSNMQQIKINLVMQDKVGLYGALFMAQSILV